MYIFYIYTFGHTKYNQSSVREKKILFLLLNTRILIIKLMSGLLIKTPKVGKF